MTEWINATTMIGIACVIIFTPKTIETGAFRYILTVAVITPVVVAAYFLFFGVLRISALYLNGQIHPYSAHMRFVGALAGALAWSLMLLALCYLTVESKTLSAGIPVYCGLVAGDLYSCLRAGRDFNFPDTPH